MIEFHGGYWTSEGGYWMAGSTSEYSDVTPDSEHFRFTWNFVTCLKVCFAGLDFSR